MSSSDQDEDSSVLLPTSTYVPGYMELVNVSYQRLNKQAAKVMRMNYTLPDDFIRDLRMYGTFTMSDVATVLLVASLLTFLRYLTTRCIFQPCSRWSRLTESSQEKMPESGWKFMFYSCSWSYTIYVLFLNGKYNYFHEPIKMWEEWSANMEVPFDIKVLYLGQLGFYLHSVFATIYMDALRKDSIVMLVHHFLTLALIGFSYAIRYHAIGTVVIFLHDVTDVCLEFTKLNVYYKNRGGRHHAINDWLSTIGFIVFASAWYLFRLYWFPLKVIWSAGNGIVSIRPELPLVCFFSALLWLLMFMNIYWFQFILLFLYKVASGQINEVEDVRETPEEEAARKRKSDERPQRQHSAETEDQTATTKNGGNSPNGIIKHRRKNLNHNRQENESH